MLLAMKNRFILDKYSSIRTVWSDPTTDSSTIGLNSRLPAE